MESAEKFRAVARAAALTGALCGILFPAGCGMPAAPHPPSLNLPAPVADLTASRTGNEVSLAWTMPKRDTSKVTLKPNIAVAVRICRAEGASGNDCATGGNLAFAPGATATFAETLPAPLASGTPRPLRYFVELTNKKGRSAGLSNAATVLAGQAPAAVVGLSAMVRKDGVVLRWIPGPPEPYETQVRLHRALLTPVAHKSTQGPLGAPAEPVKQDLLVPAGSQHGVALDKDIRFGQTYAYSGQRIARIPGDGKTLELDGPLSATVRIDVQNVFPPAVPTGLAAVATPPANGAGASIDLSWVPVSEADLAGYFVYRSQPDIPGQQPTPWRRISGPKPVVGPGFHDPGVEPGRTYDYGVSAVGRNGQESARSAPAEEAVPATQ
jgi:hypothetical protein